MKKKLGLLFVLTALCLSVVAGCGRKNGNVQQETTINETTVQQTTSLDDVNQNTSTNGSGSNYAETESGVTHNGSEGVLEEIATDIGNGVEDIGNGIENVGEDMTGETTNDANHNVNDVTSGRSAR